VRGLDHDVLKVMDFGLVKNLESGVSSPSVIGEVVGSPATMAPETLRGDPPTARTDLYSVGIVGCYLLTGALPFEGGTAAELIVAHLQQEPVPPSSQRPDVPSDLEAVLLAALAKDPTQRPASAAAMRDLLRACADAGRWPQAEAAAWWAAHGTKVRSPARQSV
jgi:serine/threonine-protein kinase